MMSETTNKPVAGLAEAAIKRMEERSMSRAQERAQDYEAEIKRYRDEANDQKEPDPEYISDLPRVKRGEVIEGLGVGQFLMTLTTHLNYEAYSDEGLTSWCMDHIDPSYPGKKANIVVAMMFRQGSRALSATGMLDASERQEMLWAFLSIMMPNLQGPLRILDFGAILTGDPSAATPIISRADYDALTQRGIALIEEMKAAGNPIDHDLFMRVQDLRNNIHPEGWIVK